MKYSSQSVQIDVKYVPEAYIVGQELGTKWYQYTFINEYSRFRYLEAFEEHSTYSSKLFLQHVVKQFPYAIECVQTDDAPEFTKRLLPKGGDTLTAFEAERARLKIRHKQIRSCTPRHNGKVELRHGKDKEEFYASHHFFF